MLSDLVGLLEDSNVDVRNDAARTVLKKLTYVIIQYSIIIR